MGKFFQPRLEVLEKRCLLASPPPVPPPSSITIENLPAQVLEIPADSTKQIIALLQIKCIGDDALRFDRLTFGPADTSAPLVSNAVKFSLLAVGLIFLALGQFGHYFVTIQQGRLMFAAVLGLLAALPNLEN